jgi:hypothetical protein
MPKIDILRCETNLEIHESVPTETVGAMQETDGWNKIIKGIQSSGVDSEVKPAD